MSRNPRHRGEGRVGLPAWTISCSHRQEFVETLMSIFKNRVQDEVIQVLAPVYGDRPGQLTWDERDGTWVAIKQVPVSPTLTRDGRRLIDVLVLIPKEYPHIPPHGIYCDLSLECIGGFFVECENFHYPELQRELRDRGWAFLCFRISEVQGVGWQPSDTVNRGDNLLTVVHLGLALIEEQRKKV